MRQLILACAAVACSLPGLASEIGDDGLHKAPWMRDTFKDLREDLEEATAEGKRLMVLIEQQGCIYCRKMHEEVFVRADVSQMIEDHYFVVQINMFGDVEVTDFDGTTLSEKDMVRRWGVLFTPNMYFFPEEITPDQTAAEAAAAIMPGAFGPGTTLDLLSWVLEEGYAGEESFQRYHARKIAERGG